jgi:hypothetical protein
MREKEISVQGAISLFRRLGFDVAKMAPEALKATRRQLLSQHHPDRGGDLNTAQLINAAYDLLKNGVPNLALYGEDLDLYETHKAENPGYPEWAWAGYAGGVPDPKIYHNDFSDVNFIKKSMWELSSHSETEYTIWGFDGHLFRGYVAVFGSPKIFHYMATAMITWLATGGNPCECRAVFVTPRNTRDIYLIYTDGKYYSDQPIKMHHQSFNFNPGNDQNFINRLPEVLNQLKDSKDHWA